MKNHYRVIRRAGFANPAVAVYHVEKRVLWWWEHAGSAFLSLEAAKEWIHKLQIAEANPIKTEIVYQQ